MTKEEKIIAIEKFDNGELLQILKTHRPCIHPSWSRHLYYIQKLQVRRISIKEKIEFITGESQGGRKIIILRN